MTSNIILNAVNLELLYNPPNDQDYEDHNFITSFSNFSNLSMEGGMFLIWPQVGMLLIFPSFQHENVFKMFFEHIFLILLLVHSFVVTKGVF